MSTSVIHPGTTRSAGPSGRFVGLAAAALAAVIALGFVFSANQGNEATESVTESRVSQAEKNAWNSRVDFLTQQYHMRQATRPSVNIERLPDGDGRAHGRSRPRPAPRPTRLCNSRPARLKSTRASWSPPEPLFSPEVARLQAVNTARLQAMWSQRYQDLIDRFENQMVPNGHEAFNPEASWIIVPVQPQSLESFRLEMTNQVRPTSAPDVDPAVRGPDGQLRSPECCRRSAPGEWLDPAIRGPDGHLQRPNRSRQGCRRGTTGAP